MPPYSEDFIRSFTKHYKEEKFHLKSLINNYWRQGTDLSDSDIEFFIEHVIDSKYDLYALKNNLYLTQWYYPFMIVVGWLEKRNKKPTSEKIDIRTDF